MKAAQEERKNVEAELRARITKEATKKVKEDMKRSNHRLDSRTQLEGSTASHSTLPKHGPAWRN